jgi:hypothetical protein
VQSLRIDALDFRRRTERLQLQRRRNHSGGSMTAPTNGRKNRNAGPTKQRRGPTTIPPKLPPLPKKKVTQ